jgi:hypothetical protein
VVVDDVEIDFSPPAKSTKSNTHHLNIADRPSTKKSITKPTLQPEVQAQPLSPRDTPIPEIKKKTAKKPAFNNRYDQHVSSIKTDIEQQEQDPMILQESSLKNLTFDHLKEQKVKIYQIQQNKDDKENINSNANYSYKQSEQKMVMKNDQISNMEESNNYATHTSKPSSGIMTISNFTNAQTLTSKGRSVSPMNMTKSGKQIPKVNSNYLDKYKIKNLNKTTQPFKVLDNNKSEANHIISED